MVFAGGGIVTQLWLLVCGRLLLVAVTARSETLIQVSERPLGTSRFYRVVQP